MCKHPDDKVELLTAAEWCSQCGALRIMVAGHLRKWKLPSAGQFDTDLALGQFARRRAKFVDQKINNASLPAGSPMHYYCRFCCAPTETLPEIHLKAPETACIPCLILHEMGLI
jgi:hypothetical protein